MKETQKKHAKPVFPNGFVLRLIAAIAMVIPLISLFIGPYPVWRSSYRNYAIPLICLQVVLSGLFLMTAFVGKKHAWANDLCFVLSIFWLFYFFGFVIIGIIFGVIFRPPSVIFIVIFHRLNFWIGSMSISDAIESILLFITWDIPSEILLFLSNNTIYLPFPSLYPLRRLILYLSIEFSITVSVVGLLCGVAVIIVGILGAVQGNRVLAVQKKSDGILDKVVNARGKTANEQVFKELLACMKKKDDAAFQAIVDRENAFYESVKDIMFTPDEAKTACARLCNMATVLEGKPAAKTLRGEWKSMYEERDFAKLRAVLSEYEPRYDAWIRKNVNGVPSDYVPEMDGEGGFDGRVIQRFGWQLLCRFVDLITLMIAKPFTICWMMRWECKHTVYKGKRLSFDGNGLQLWGKYMLWWLLSVITLGIYSFFVAVRLEKWKAKHTHLAGEIAAFGGGFDGWVIQQVGWRLLCSLVNCLTLFIAFPATLCWMEKWKFKHRIYDGVRLRFNGNGIQLFGKWLLWLLLSVVTLGIYTIFLPIKINDWKAKHVELSTEREFLG